MPQAGIFSDPSTYHYFLEYRVPERADLAEICEALRQILAWAPAGADAGDCYRVVGFGHSLWERYGADEPPGLLRPFSAIEGPEDKAVPATQNDLWVWLHGPRHDLNFSLAMYASSLLNGEAMLRLEQPGFSYLDSRDLTGFIDGTANPSSEEAEKVALIPRGLAGEGGSYVLAMRWVHDLGAFGELSVPEQEAVIGRTKVESLELNQSRKLSTSHISRMEVEEDGEELQILRRSVPYGSLQEQGLYFLAFAADPTRYDKMLARMFGQSEDGIVDRLTDFSRPVSGAYYYAPSRRALGLLLD